MSYIIILKQNSDTHKALYNSVEEGKACINDGNSWNEKNT